MNLYYDHAGITIYQGDCRDVLPSLILPRRTAVISDPPYGDDHDTDYTRFTGGAGVPTAWHARIDGDNAPFDPTFLLDLQRTTVLFGANRFSDKLPCGSWLIWDKRTPGGNKNIMSDAEVAWCSEGRGVYIFEHTWDGFNRASERGTKYHPTQKPVAVMRWIIARLKLPTDTVIIDPYMGAGATLIAAKELGYQAIGIELQAAYCETTVKRLQQEILPLFEQEAA